MEFVFAHFVVSETLRHNNFRPKCDTIDCTILSAAYALKQNLEMSINFAAGHRNSYQVS